MQILRKVFFFHASDNEGVITDHQYKFENDPQNLCMYGEEQKKFHDEDNLLLRFVNINGLKKEIRKEKFTSHENIKRL